MKKWCYKLSNKNLLIHIGIILVLCIACLYPIREFDFPAVLNDEFGYWGNAISIKGYDWKDLIAETPYYSWGYSIWLIPLVFIFKDYYILYKAGIFLNVIFLIVSYLCCFYIGKKLFPTNKKVEIAAISFLTVYYPSNIVFAQVTWSESLLFLLTWLVLVTLVSLEENFKYYKVLLCICILGYMYTVHQRSIGIILIGIASLFLIMLTNQKPLQYWIFPIVILAMWYFFAQIVKDIQLEKLWSNSELSSINNVGFNSATLSMYIGKLVGGFKNLILSILGKSFYLLVATGSIIIPAGFICIKKIRTYMKFIKTKNSELYIPYFFALGCFLVMGGICSLQMLDATTRKDIIVYSRYMENALGPILLIGFAWTLNKSKQYKKLLLIGISFVIANCFWIGKTVESAEGFFNTICSPVIGSFYEFFDGDIKKMFFSIVVFGIGVPLFLMVLTLLKKRRFKFVYVFVLFFVSYTILGYEAESYVLDWRTELDQNITVVRDYIMSEYPDQEIYYVKDKNLDEYSVNPKYLQFMMPENKITVIDKNACEGVLKEKEVVVLMNSGMEDDFEDLVPELQTNMLKMYYLN